MFIITVKLMEEELSNINNDTVTTLQMLNCDNVQF